MTGQAKLKVAILGASGYSGAELVRLLAKHPAVEITALGADSAAGQELSQLYPALRGLKLPALAKLDASALKGKADLVFLGLPHTESMKLVPGLLDAGLRVIDLSGDFRLQDSAAYAVFYKAVQIAPELLQEAVYGLSEIYADKIKGARLIANPGCYTTTAILALYPLLKAGLIAPQGIIIDAKSGTSGAGRKLAAGTQFCEVDNNFSAYKVGGTHQHIPEIEQELGSAAGVPLKVSFTPHLLPLSRGIFATSYAQVTPKAGSAQVLVEALRSFYAGRHFVRVLDAGQLPTLRSVVGTNMIEIGVALDARASRAIVFSATDNLLKGAAGQAVQNMNIMMGWHESEGLHLSALPV